MRSSHRPRPKQAHDLVARSWSRCLSWPKPAAPGTPLGLLEPIGQQHMQHIAEARSALARGAVMASTRNCAIAHPRVGCPAGKRRCGNAKLQPGLIFFLVRARAANYLYECMHGKNDKNCYTLLKMSSDTNLPHSAPTDGDAERHRQRSS